MTLSELFQLIRHFLKFVVIVSICGAVCGCGFSLATYSQNFKAESVITASDPSGNVSSANLLSLINSQMQADITEASLDNPDMKANIKIEATGPIQTLTLTVETPNADKSIEIVNYVAESTVNQSLNTLEQLERLNKDEQADLSSLNNSEDVASVLSGSLLQNVLGNNRTFKFCSISAKPASVATATEMKLEVKAILFTILGLVAGFALALVAVLALCIIKGRIKNQSDIRPITDIPVLSLNYEENLGDRIWASIQFNVDGPINSICVVPLGKNQMNNCASSLQKAIERTCNQAKIINVNSNDIANILPNDEKIIIFNCSSVSSGTEALYCANAASATIICVSSWNNTLIELQKCIQEIRLAKANIICIVLFEN